MREGVLGFCSPAPIGLDGQWNANPPQGPALGVVGDVFAHLGHPSCRTTSDLRFGQRNRVKLRGHCDVESSWFACGPIGHQVVGWPASGTINLSPSSHLELTTQASPVAELGNDIMQAVVAQDSVPTSPAR